MKYYALMLLLLLASVTACAKSADERTTDSVPLDARMKDHPDASSPTDLRARDVEMPDAGSIDTGPRDAVQSDGGTNRRDAVVADLPAQIDAGVYIEAMGDIDTRDECNVICAGVNRICDGQYDHFLFGPVGGTVMHEDVGGELTCDERPEETITPAFDGETRQLTSYVCYCREA